MPRLTRWSIRNFAAASRCLIPAFRVLTANGDELTDSSDPSRVMMRQIAGAFHQYEKARLVAKLRQARQRKRETQRKVEGRKRWSELKPDMVAVAKRLRRRSPKGHQRSLRQIADELAELGYINERGVKFSPSSVQHKPPQRRLKS
jgi:DNA invertase Pin-like site-specific DNA recombinase